MRARRPNGLNPGVRAVTGQTQKNGHPEQKSQRSLPKGPGRSRALSPPPGVSATIWEAAGEGDEPQEGGRGRKVFVRSSVLD